MAPIRGIHAALHQLFLLFISAQLWQPQANACRLQLLWASKLDVPWRSSCSRCLLIDDTGSISEEQDNIMHSRPINACNIIVATNI
jgi:hypothetical protein